MRNGGGSRLRRNGPYVEYRIIPTAQSAHRDHAVLHYLKNFATKSASAGISWPVVLTHSS